MSDHTIRDDTVVAVVMGSKSDWQTMTHAVAVLEQFNINYHVQVVSAHRTPDLLFQFAQQAEQNKIQVIIAGAGGAAHLPGMLAAKTIVPVLGVPIETSALSGMDSLLSIVQMPAGIPVPTLAIGKAGAKNAALAAIAILANKYDEVAIKLKKFRVEQTQSVMENLTLEALV